GNRRQGMDGPRMRLEIAHATLRATARPTAVVCGVCSNTLTKAAAAPFFQSVSRTSRLSSAARFARHHAVCARRTTTTHHHHHHRTYWYACTRSGGDTADLFVEFRVLAVHEIDEMGRS